MLRYMYLVFHIKIWNASYTRTRVHAGRWEDGGSAYVHMVVRATRGDMGIEDIYGILLICRRYFVG